MEIWLKAQASLSGGAQVSGELVADELAREVEGTSVDVEDSTYDVDSVEVVAGPKSGGRNQAAIDEVLVAVDDLFTVYFERFPIRITPDDTPEPERTSVESEVEHLMFRVRGDLGAEITAAKTRVWKRQQKEAQR